MVDPIFSGATQALQRNIALGAQQETSAANLAIRMEQLKISRARATLELGNALRNDAKFIHEQLKTNLGLLESKDLNVRVMGYQRLYGMPLEQAQKSAIANRVPITVRGKTEFVTPSEAAAVDANKARVINQIGQVIHKMTPKAAEAAMLSATGNPELSRMLARDGEVVIGKQAFHYSILSKATQEAAAKGLSFRAVMQEKINALRNIKTVTEAYAVSEKLGETRLAELKNTITNPRLFSDIERVDAYRQYLDFVGGKRTFISDEEILKQLDADMVPVKGSLVGSDKEIVNLSVREFLETAGLRKESALSKAIEEDPTASDLAGKSLFLNNPGLLSQTDKATQRRLGTFIIRFPRGEKVLADALVRLEAKEVRRTSFILEEMRNPETSGSRFTQLQAELDALFGRVFDDRGPFTVLIDAIKSGLGFKTSAAEVPSRPRTPLARTPTARKTPRPSEADVDQSYFSTFFGKR